MTRELNRAMYHDGPSYGPMVPRRTRNWQVAHKESCQARKKVTLNSSIAADENLALCRWYGVRTGAEKATDRSS